MLEDPWSGDLSPTWEVVVGAFGNPSREEAVLAWLRRRTPSEWARLDENQRRWGRGRCDVPARAGGTLAEGWRSFDADGFVRERAVAALERDPHEAALGFLLVRCDDWVAPVRSRARAAVLTRAAAGHMDVAGWMPLLLARDGRTRGDGLAAACVANCSRGFVEGLLDHPDRATKRWALERLLDGNPGVDDLARLLARTQDATTACRLAQRLANLRDEAGLPPLLADRRAGVRRAAWEQVALGRLPELDLSRGLMDNSATIRGLAQQAARARRFPAAALYLGAPERTATERRRRLAWLGEWGAAEAVPLARSLLEDPDVLVRITSIRVLALRMDHPEALLLDLLQSTRGAELRAVARGLTLNQVRVADDALALLRGGAADQRAVAWRLGARRGRWERLLADLHALGDPDARLAADAHADLGSWRRHVLPEAGLPPEALRPLLEAALAEAARRGPEVSFVAWLLRR